MQKHLRECQYGGHHSKLTGINALKKRPKERKVGGMFLDEVNERRGVQADNFVLQSS
jgi:hypothetical protein